MYETWDLKIPEIPTRTRLYPLEPIGKETPLVESLTSYILRLADAHSVPVGILVNRELVPLRPVAQRRGRWKDRREPRSSTVSLTSYSINGLEDGPSRWVQALEAATLRKDLSQLTLLRFRGFFCYIHFFRRVRAWCPSCLEQWRLTGRTVYEPLLWSLSLAKVCPYHRCYLADRCPSCHRQMAPVTSDSRSGHCARCYRWLGEANDGAAAPSESLSSETSVEAQRAEKLGDLLACSSQLSGGLLRSNFLLHLRRCVHELFKGNATAFAHFVNCPAGDVQNWLNEATIPYIDRFLQVCIRLEVPPLAFLSDPSQEETVDWSSVASRIDHDRPVRRYRRKDETLRALELAVREQPSPSLREIARRLGYSGTEGLRGVASEICKQITKNYENSFIPEPYHKGPRPRICAVTRVEAALRKSLAQRIPEPVAQTAVRLGYASPSPLQAQFPDLCRTIQAKLASRKKTRLEAKRRIVIRALDGSPPPSLRELAHRLGYRDKKIIRRYFPELNAALIVRREAHEQSQFRHLTSRLQGMLREQPPPLVGDVARRLRLSSSTLWRKFPDLSRSIAARSPWHRKKS